MKNDYCPWCYTGIRPMKSFELEWTVIDDDFAQPVPLKAVRYCFCCGRKLDKDGDGDA